MDRDTVLIMVGLFVVFISILRVKEWQETVLTKSTLKETFESLLKRWQEAKTDEEKDGVIADIHNILPVHVVGFMDERGFHPKDLSQKDEGFVWDINDLQRAVENWPLFWQVQGEAWKIWRKNLPFLRRWKK